MPRPLIRIAKRLKKRVGRTIKREKAGLKASGKQSSSDKFNWKTLKPKPKRGRKPKSAEQKFREETIRQRQATSFGLGSSLTKKRVSKKKIKRKRK